MATKYKTVPTNTVAGVEESERLHARGWKTLRVGLFTETLYRTTLSKRQKRKRNAVEAIARAVGASLRAQQEE